MIVSKCAASRSRAQATGVTRRKLSDSGEGFDEEAILEDCLALEAELGISRPEPPPSAHGDRSRRIAELVSMFYEAASSYESMQSRQQTGGGVTASPTFPGQSPVHPHSQYPKTQGFVVAYPGGHTYWQNVQVHAPSGSFGPGQAVSPLDPSPWIGETSTTSHIQGASGQEPPSWVANTGSGGYVRHRAAPAVRLLPKPSGRQDGDYGADNHPYVRIPVLQQGVVPKKFRPSAIFADKLTDTMIYLPMLSLRSLFSKQSLNQEDADNLITASEALARAAWVNALTCPRLTSPSFANEFLGRSFLALDSLVCTFQVLGDRMQKPVWWEEFIAAFDTNYDFRGERSRGCTQRYIRQFANRLLAALNIYKTGGRPPADEVIVLKRLLFSTKCSPKEFQDPIWDPWREDDELFVAHGYHAG
ncbi:uncharacterized protein EMH_0044680 [Eimeria mitis]|uniref:Uncharacterized protein n=1 Tax=Eimeria mitis TaxID=44415 RepID=U6K8J3_9EIME|nr:uncharacterized protein EMH_0044680 [Eimeria mitis]CDJ32512.1 hypothetical protein, conserved [Eimeria mitis]